MQGVLTDVLTTLDEIERFAALVAAAEREACAKVCDTRALQFHSPSPFRAELQEVAAAIRARGET
jgi:hypothetical protein